MKKYLILILSLILGSIAYAKPIDIMDFAKSAEYTGVKVSPDGKYLAATAPVNDQTVLVIINRKNMEISHVVRFRKNEHVDKYYWANNERVVFTRVIKSGWDEQPITRGQIYATNFDGSKDMPIFGYQVGGAQIGTRLNRSKAPVYAFGDILHLLPDDPNHILISSRSMESSYDASIKLYKLNIYSQRRKYVAGTPFGNMSLLMTQSGKPFMSYGYDRSGIKRSFFYEKNNWREVPEKHPIFGLTPVQVDSEKKQILLTGRRDGQTDALYIFDQKTNELKKVFQDPNSDIYDYITDPISKEVVGVELMPGKIQYNYTQPKHKFAKLHKSLAKAFDGHSIDITSQTNNLDELVVLIRSDKNPGEFYLFNQENKTADFLLSSKRWIEPSLMAERKPIQFKNRNGQVIHGYLTLPTNVTEKSDKKVPLIVNVHGGPYGVRDTWWYDGESQFLANNGFAVLQINFRGSGGYGRDFEEVAYQKQSSLIQEDIIDGTRWALTQDNIDDKKACIMGWSFGGYSALMAPLKEPDLYQCSVAAAGFYDAVEQEEDADYSNIDSSAARAAVLYGTDELALKSESPITYLDKLKIPVFIVHGGKDRRVPPEQAYMLKKALDERRMPYEWMFKETEGHGFYDENNQKEFFERTLSFFEKHLK